MRKLVLVAATLAVAACSEVPQDDPKVKAYAGKIDEKAYAGDAFKGDKAKWEGALATRATLQNDYAPSRAAGKK